jgi:pimeloyl-ACP methyl ester carboxylesterase
MQYLEGYLLFNKTYETRIFHHALTDIEYQVIGEGEEKLLMLLESSMFDTQAYYRLLLLMAKRYQIIIINSLKPIYRHSVMSEAIDDLFKFLHIDKIHIIGMNHGGSLALYYAKYYTKKVKSLILYHSIAHTSFMNEEAFALKEFLLKTIEELKDLRKQVTLNQIKMSLLDQIKAYVTQLEDVNYDEAIEYIEYLISLFDTDDEVYQMSRIKDFLTEEPLNKENFKDLERRSYIVYGNDEDPIFGTAMLEVAIDLFEQPKVEYLNLNKFEIILKPHKFAYKIIKYIESLSN